MAGADCGKAQLQVTPSARTNACIIGDSATTKQVMGNGCAGGGCRPSTERRSGNIQSLSSAAQNRRCYRVFYAAQRTGNRLRHICGTENWG